MNPSQAMVRSVRDLLRSELPLRVGHCGEHEDHRPPARSGQYYVSVFASEFSFSGLSEAQFVLDRTIGVTLGITQRTGVVAPDRLQAEINKDHGVVGLFHAIDGLIRERRYELIECAPALLDAKWSGEFVEPLRRAGGNLAVRSCGPEHFRAEMREGCTDYGAYLILPFNGARYMQKLDSAGEGINYWYIEQDFIIQPTEDDTWELYIEDALVNGRSGDYGAFSGDSQFVAVLKSGAWKIYGRDGSERDVATASAGGLMKDFMWSSSNDYFWVQGSTLSLKSLNGTLTNSWELPSDPGGKGRSVTWRSGTGSNGSKQFVIGLYDMGNDVYAYYIQAVNRMGLQEGYWVEDIPTRDEVRWHNIMLRDGYGYGGRLAGDDQGHMFIVSYDGTEVEDLIPSGFSHESFQDNEVLYFEHTNDGLELMNITTGLVTATISQQDLKDATGLTAFVAGGHSDLRGNGAVISVNEYNTNNWYLLYWSRHTLKTVKGPVYSPRPTSGEFKDAILPTMSTNNRYIAYHEDGGVRIATV